MSDAFYGACPHCKKPIAGDNLFMGNDLVARCMACWIHGEDHTIRNPELTRIDQFVNAQLTIDRPLREYVQMPFASVDRLVGAIPPGDVGFLAAFSGNGKTTYITSAIKGFIAQGKCVYCLPLESEPNTFLTHLACKNLGYHAGMVLTGEYKRSQPDIWPSIREAIIAEMKRIQTGEMADQLYISPTKHMDVKALKKAAAHAFEIGADILIIDHIDHVQGEGRNVIAEHSRVVDTTLDVTQEYGLVTVCTSQLNNEMLRGDVLGMYMPPQPQHVYMGGKKRQNAAWMIGAYRPLKLTGVDKDLLKAIKQKRMEPWRALEPNCMGIVAMKLRHFGEREGHRVYLGVKDGCVYEDPNLNDVGQHGIKTGIDKGEKAA